MDYMVFNANKERKERIEMENPKNIKRSIRIPKEMNERLQEIADKEKKSVNQIILRIIKERIW